MKFEPKFYLDNPKLKETFVIMAVTCADGRLKYSTGKKIDPKAWTKERKKLPSDIQAKIMSMEGSLSTFKAYCDTIETQVTKAALKEHFERQDNKAPKVSKPKINSGSFETDTKKIIELMGSKKIKNQKTGKVYAPNTITAIDNTKDSLLKFSTEKNISVSFEDTTEETYKMYCDYLDEQKFKISTLNARIGYWKTLAFHAQNSLDQKIKINDWFNNKKFKMFPSPDAETIALSEQDIQKLLKLKLEGNDKIIRDFFVANCNTGLRIGDQKRLTKGHIQDNKITIVTQKRGKKVSIPVSNQLSKILKEYNGEFPPALSESHINDRIKEIARLAGIKKFELITNHTARRTFATELIKTKYNPIVLDRILAMTPNTQRRYAKIETEEAADIVADADLFNR